VPAAKSWRRAFQSGAISFSRLRKFRFLAVGSVVQTYFFFMTRVPVYNMKFSLSL